MPRDEGCRQLVAGYETVARAADVAVYALFTSTNPKLQAKDRRIIIYFPRILVTSQNADIKNMPSDNPKRRR